LTGDRVPGHEYSIPSLSRTKFLAHQVWAIWLIVSRWVSNTDMPGALGADEIGLGKTFTSVAAGIICKLVTKNVLFGLPLSTLWGTTLEHWVILAHTNVPGNLSEEQECCPL
jgi:hypothetical protein